MPDELRIRWSVDPKDFVDVFNSDVLSGGGKSKVFKHQVLRPNGMEYGMAKCRASLSGKTADLDYTAFSTFNTQQRMELGVLRLHFEDLDRTKFSNAEWKDVGGEGFSSVDVTSVEYILPPLSPYVLAPADPKKVLRPVQERPGQKQFRSRLKKAYESCCCVSGCNVPDALEGAHIDPYRGPQFDHPQNGLLLRRDLHTLFDKNLLGIEPATRKLDFAEQVLCWLEYASLQGQSLKEPVWTSYRPSEAALKRRWEVFAKNALKGK